MFNLVPNMPLHCCISKFISAEKSLPGNDMNLTKVRNSLIVFTAKKQNERWYFQRKTVLKSMSVHKMVKHKLRKSCSK